MDLIVWDLIVLPFKEHYVEVLNGVYGMAGTMIWL